MSILKVRTWSFAPCLFSTVTVPVGLTRTFPVFAMCVTICWKPRCPPVVTRPIVKPSTGGPGTFTCTATIVRSRILIRTLALFFDFGWLTWCEVSATTPPTHCPGFVFAGTRTVNGTVRCCPGLSVSVDFASEIHAPACCALRSVRYTVPVVCPVPASAA